MTMHKISLAVSSMIVTAFLVKSYRKLREKQEPELDELHRRMRAAYEHLKIESRRAAARQTFARMDAISTPRDGGLMSSIDTLQQMAPGRPALSSIAQANLNLMASLEEK